MSDYLPPEVLIDILTRLPIESLVQCTSVCKSWYSLITNPSFITTHLNRTIADNDSHLLVRHCAENSKKEYYSLHCDDETFDEYAKFVCPFECLNDYYRVIGSSNGLICLSEDQFSYNHEMILWNPSIRKSVILPLPNVTFDTHGPFMHTLGFGFDPISNDYKVVRVVHLGSCCDRVPPEVELYTLSTGAWRNISDVAPPYLIGERSPQAFMKGATHWVASDRSKLGSYKHLIVSFDIHDEVFHEIMLPDSVAREAREIWPVSRRVSIFKESLALILHDPSRDRPNCCIWVMKEYGVMDSWTKQFTIDLSVPLEETLGFRKNGEVLLASRGGFLVSYDPKAEQIMNLGIRGSTRSTYWHSFHVDTYVESLVFLERGAEFCDTVTSKLVVGGVKRAKNMNRKAKKKGNKEGGGSEQGSN